MADLPLFAAPKSVAELVEAIATARDEKRVVELRGAGTRAGIGAPRRERALIDMRGFSEIIDYEPAELVLTLGAGTPLAEAQRLLAANGQWLAFEPAGGTIGGMVASGLSGPRRPFAGGVRDHVLGIEAVSGRGEAFKAGGRVVKNVTGYDLPRLMTGSWGRLAALTAVSIKVLPRPRVQTTVLVSGLDDAAGLALLGEAAASPAEISGAAHLPAGSGAPVALTALRLEGFGPSVEARAAMLRAMAPAARLVSGEDSRTLWRAVREGKALQRGETLWRITLPAASAGAFVGSVKEARWMCDWAGGLVWVAAPERLDVRGWARAAGGQAMLVRASAAMRARTPALHPEAVGVAALRARVKAGFDPANILDPGRFG